jgi:hypothetical protein
LIDCTLKIWAQAKTLILVKRSKKILADNMVSAPAYAGAMA